MTHVMTPVMTTVRTTVRTTVMTPVMSPVMTIVMMVTGYLDVGLLYCTILKMRGILLRGLLFQFRRPWFESEFL